MTTCSHCGTPAAPEDQFCRHCGYLLATAPVKPAAARSDVTVRAAGGLVRSWRVQRSAVALDTLFAVKERVVIGRAPDCDVCLPHPTVSRYHALLERSPQGLRLRDLGSVNGVTVGGRRLTEAVILQERQRVGIGPYLFTLSDGVITSLDSSRSLRLEARGLERVVALKDGGTRKLLDGINLVIEPGEFVSLLGPSGSGKSTLMDALNGRRRATRGTVLANGEDFYQHFDSFRQSLGYVPQKDIVHTQLTVYKALAYTARLRLPSDTAPAELRGRVEEVLREMDLGPHRHTLVANLSGGQIKRVSLGAELLARPCLLYIDEATSGLDAGTEARMMRLFRDLADEGRSIVCITHNVDNVDRCHLALILASGRLVYYGPPSEAPAYFGVGRLGEIYDRLADKEPRAWAEEFEASSLHQEFVAGRLASSPVEPGEGASPPRAAPVAGGLFGNVLAQASLAASASGRDVLAARLRWLTSRYLKTRELVRPLLDTWRQFLVLTARYGELLLGDRRSLSLLFLQAPLVALFILLGFANKPYEERVPVPRELTGDERLVLEQARDAAEPLGEPGRKAGEMIGQLLAIDGPAVPDFERPSIVNPRYTYLLLNILVITVMWFGCNNAAKEIVKEEAVYSRERSVNLGILPYLASKFLLLSAVSVVQAALLMAVVYGGLEVLHAALGHPLPYHEYRLGYAGEFGVLALLSMVGVALGLLLSACVNSPDRANALLPYVLIPQIILGGGMLPLADGPLHALGMVLSPVYWAFRGVHRGAPELPVVVPYHMDYDDSVWIACAALAVQTAALLGPTAWFLRRKDVGRG